MGNPWGVAERGAVAAALRGDGTDLPVQSHTERSVSCPRWGEGR